MALRFKRRKKVQEKFAFALLYLLASLAFVALFGILGFILVRGFWTDTNDFSQFLAETSESYLYNDEEWQLVVNRGVRLRRITTAQMNDVADGNLINYTNLSGQDLFIRPMVLINTEQLTEAQAHLQQLGAFIYGPQNLTGRLVGGRVVPVRQWQLVANNAVFGDRRTIATLTAAEQQQLLEGGITNWQQLNGENLAVIKAYSLAELQANPSAFMQTTFFESNQLDDVRVINVWARRQEPNLTLSMLIEAPRMAGAAGGFSTIILNTIYMIALSLLIAVPFGVGTAIYLTHYAKKGKLVKVLRTLIDILAGIPSIIFGLFGFIIFVGILGFGIGLLSGCLTLSLMLLPTLMKNAEEALKTVPAGYKDGSLALGANLWQTVFFVLIPAARNGILTGIVLAAGRVMGESAALVLTMGFDYGAASSLFSSSRVLTTHLYMLIREGISIERAFAVAALLAIIVLVTNFLASKLISGRKNA
ncbi:MAG: phosphate ABC transporter permease PstA [Spirochaetaceae bacterium]|nr:phosphate ABC transporter permease PstA [Spirochaetaceae bacterium]